MAFILLFYLKLACMSIYAKERKSKYSQIDNLISKLLKSKEIV